MTSTDYTQHKLARRFAGVLREWLTPEQMAEVNRRNLAETDRRICHSHDFCDANQAMIDAETSMGLTLDLGDDGHVALIDDAWRIAKAARFFVPPEPQGEFYAWDCNVFNADGSLNTPTCYRDWYRDEAQALRETEQEFRQMVKRFGSVEMGAPGWVVVHLAQQESGVTP